MSANTFHFKMKMIGPNGFTDTFPAEIGPGRPLRLANDLLNTDIHLKTPDIGEWFIGTLAQESWGRRRMMTASKVHLDTKLLTLAAVARAVKAHNDPDVELTIGVPVEFNTPQIRDEMQRLLIGNYDVGLNGEPIHFQIHAVRMIAEGPSAYAALCPGEMGIKRIIDVGSRTINFGSIQNGRYLDVESGTLDYGCDTEDSDPQALAGRIAGDLSRIWKNFSSDTYVIGGGAIKHTQYLASYFPQLLNVANPQWVNARAFYAIGEQARQRPNG